MASGLTLTSGVPASPKSVGSTVMVAVTVLVVDVDVDVALALVFITPVVLRFSGRSKTECERISSVPSSGNSGSSLM